MSSTKLIRAWKDEEYRLSLSEAERAQLPENPAGALELSESDLDQVAGGGWHIDVDCVITIVICKYTFDCFITFKFGHV
jgi:mersacidin/lichenicidin family type 2 lantibiotic